MKKISLVVLAGLSISFTAFAIVQQWEEDKRQQEYNHRAYAHTAVLIGAFQSLEKQLKDVRFVIEYGINDKEEITRTPYEFMNMLTPMFAHKPALEDLDWVKVDPVTNQAHIIYSLKHHNHLEKGVAPLSHQTITARITKEPQTGYLLQFITPITNQSNPINQHQLKGDVVAALVSEWNVKTIVEEALKNTPITAQDIILSSIEGNKTTEIYFRPSRSRTEAEKDIDTNISYTTTLTVAGLSLQAKFQAAPKFIRDFPITLAWQTLFTLLLSTLLLAWYIYKRDRYTAHVERLIEKRTKELNKQRKKLRLIIENLQDVYYHMDHEGIIQMVSPAIALLGYTEGEVVGTNMNNYTQDKKTFKDISRTLQLSNEGKIHNYHLQAKHKDGHTLWLSLNAQYTYNSKKEITGIDGTLRDFTQSKENQEKMEKSDKFELLGLMAGGIAHNFNNILTSILGRASIARMDLDDGLPIEQHLEIIEQSSLKAAEICKQMLAYSGKGKFAIQSVNLNQTIEGVSVLVQASLSQHVNVQYKLQADLPTILVDNSQIQQLIIDIIFNAVEAYDGKEGDVIVQTGCKTMRKSDFKSCIDTESDQAGEYIFLAVTDEACGIASDMQQRIFEPFVTTKFTGRGLGLSSVRGIVRSHHGAIMLKSAEGKGTTITILFPTNLPATDS